MQFPNLFSKSIVAFIEFILSLYMPRIKKREKKDKKRGKKKRKKKINIRNKKDKDKIFNDSFQLIIQIN